jgi:23S rRNA pseudouridine2605 synthase
MRINRFLAECGIASRRKAEELVLQRRIVVNGKTVSTLAFNINIDKDKVFVDGEPVRSRKHVYFLLHKPKGYVSTTNDEKKRPTVVSLIKTNEKIFPVGRLDYNTTGVLVLTNDGDFAQLLSHPSNNIPREYEVKLDKPLKEKDEEKLLRSVFVEGVRGKFSSIKYPANSLKNPTVITHEGRNHFVKNMFAALGYRVIGLHRKSFGNITLINLPEGAYRQLTPNEIKGIKKHAK